MSLIPTRRGTRLHWRICGAPALETVEGTMIPFERGIALEATYCGTCYVLLQAAPGASLLARRQLDQTGAQELADPRILPLGGGPKAAEELIFAERGAPLRSGRCVAGHGESWSDWIVFPASLSDQEADQEAIEASGLYRYGTDSPYDCTGRPFSHGPYVKVRSKSRVLVTSNGGLDV